VYHLDLYRLNSARELVNLGWDDVLRDEALVLIEWPERAGGRIPAEALHIEIEHHPTDAAKRLLLAG
jgi:tRNA threonylcarbamoyl adenosine modification protein YjeE